MQNLSSKMSLRSIPPAILVYGANGHTGRFIVRELGARGMRPVLSGRNREQLNAMSAAQGGLEVRAAQLDEPHALRQALTGMDAVINAAGPFSFTAAPVIDAAIQARIPYLDIAAETDITAATIANHGERARLAGVPVVPAAGFYGGLGNLLATSAMGNWDRADEIVLAYSLSSWKATVGTRATIESGQTRRGGRRLVFTNHGLELRSDDAPTTEWNFPSPIGRQAVAAEFTTADCVTISRHLQAGAITEYMTLAPLKDLSDPDLSPPVAVDEQGRSAQTFLLQAVVRRGDQRRSAIARGRDIYALSAPLVVEAAQRLLLSAPRRHGVVTTAELGDARAYLESLAPRHLELGFE
jgi:NAD(P)-dependent dehydrogenase (short-subunit alcohol dehydrogenase family)